MAVKRLLKEKKVKTRLNETTVLGGSFLIKWNTRIKHRTYGPKETSESQVGLLPFQQHCRTSWDPSSYLGKKSPLQCIEDRGDSSEVRDVSLVHGPTGFEFKDHSKQFSGPTLVLTASLWLTLIIPDLLWRSSSSYHGEDVTEVSTKSPIPILVPTHVRYDHKKDLDCIDSLVYSKTNEYITGVPVTTCQFFYFYLFTL